jgi:hypothetical protein
MVIGVGRHLAFPQTAAIAENGGQQEIYRKPNQSVNAKHWGSRGNFAPNPAEGN